MTKPALPTHNVLVTLFSCLNNVLLILDLIGNNRYEAKQALPHQFYQLNKHVALNNFFLSSVS